MPHVWSARSARGAVAPRSARTLKTRTDSWGCAHGLAHHRHHLAADRLVGGWALFCVVAPTFLVLLGYQALLLAHPPEPAPKGGSRTSAPTWPRWRHRVPGLPALGRHRPVRPQTGRLPLGRRHLLAAREPPARPAVVRRTLDPRGRHPDPPDRRRHRGGGRPGPGSAARGVVRRRPAAALPRAAHRRAGRRLQPGLPDRDRRRLPAPARGPGADQPAHPGLTRTPALRPHVPGVLRAPPARGLRAAADPTRRPPLGQPGPRDRLHRRLGRTSDDGAVDHWILDPPVLWEDADPAPPPTHRHSNWFSDPQTRPYAERLL